MDADQTLRVVRELKQVLTGHGMTCDRIEEGRADMNEPPIGETAPCHAHWMLGQMENWLLDAMSMNQKKWEKVQRWLGFVQGVVWSAGIRSIEEMRKMNTSEG